MSVNEKNLYIIMITVLAGFALAGVVEQGVFSSLKGFLELQIHPARLLNDYTLAGGEGAALLNASLVGLIGLVLVKLNRIRLSGPTVAAVFTMMGFGLFGKTTVNILPIILGVYISAKTISKSFREYILIALFGTALGPMVTLVMFEIGLSGSDGLSAGVAAGIIIGIFLPSLAIGMLHLHQGYNLYNLGMTCGFLSLFAAAVFAAAGYNLPLGTLWNSEPSLIISILVPVLSVFLIASGFIMGRKKSLSDFAMIQSFTGRLPSDFMEMASISGSLVNMGLLGVAGSLYVYFTKTPFNGPVIGGLLTLIGFGSFGKHLNNSLPVVAGVLIGCLLFGKNPSDPGPALAALFCTTLAPIAGEYGKMAGVAAGVIHLTMVERTGAWHSGMDLYNNGFAGGLTATLLVAVIEWYRSNIKKSES